MTDHNDPAEVTADAFLQAHYDREITDIDSSKTDYVVKRDAVAAIIRKAYAPMQAELVAAKEEIERKNKLAWKMLDVDHEEWCEIGCVSETEGIGSCGCGVDQLHSYATAIITERSQ